MGGQRTFTLIPQHPGRNDAPDAARFERPMTSKQVQKAYKAANRGPKMTRIERIKHEKAEQERIRKEFEKERAASKARAAREKKKGKALAEREEKRKKGLPLVNVRPSQDTISRFVRGNGTTKKRDAEGEQMEAKEAKNTETLDLPTAAPKLDDIVEEEDEADIEDLAIELEKPCPPPPLPPPIPEPETIPEEKKKDEKETNNKKQKMIEEDGNFTQDLDDYFDKEAFDFFSPPVVTKPKLISKPGPIAEEKKKVDLDPWSDSNPWKKDHGGAVDGPFDVLDDNEDAGDLDDYFDEELAQDMLQDILADAQEAAMKNQLKTNHTRPHCAHMSMELPEPSVPKESSRPTRKPTPYEEDLGIQKQTPMAPPPRPSTVKLARRSPSRSPSPPRQAPPLSTQAILSNFDDFFPSPSQQARELEEEITAKSTPSKAISPLHSQKEPHPPEPSLPEPRPDSPSPPPRRFFTSSGSHELMSLALQRSRRTAELEKIQQRDRLRTQTGMAFRQEAEAAARAQRNKLKPQPVKTAHTPQRHVPPAAQKAPERSIPRTNTRPPVQINKGRPMSSTAHATPRNGLPKAPTPTVPKTNTKPMIESLKARPAPTTPNANTKTIPQLPKAASPIVAKVKAAINENKENTELAPAREVPGPSASQESEYGGGDWMDDIELDLMI
ncbi:hypothetical protein B0T10DRAFT_559988 [Thelonectria olida]|uniref:Uncharacterized protein n=1 Tax=Thelonectria olida TaxID=1576542 RepID=A0A9P8W7E9_9HYPO|nr:hypothetical protein B0T10DRAFT_559988 [Thelonectria olida]